MYTEESKCNVFEDHSYPSPEQQLKWRIEDLKERLCEISTGFLGVSVSSLLGCRYSDKDIACITPEYFFCEKDVIRAICIAEEELRLMTQETNEEVQTVSESIEREDEIEPGQISMWDYPRLYDVEDNLFLENAA